MLLFPVGLLAAIVLMPAGPRVVLVERRFDQAVAIEIQREFADNLEAELAGVIRIASVESLVEPLALARKRPDVTPDSFVFWLTETEGSLVVHGDLIKGGFLRTLELRADRQTSEETGQLMATWVRVMVQETWEVIAEGLPVPPRPPEPPRELAPAEAETKTEEQKPPEPPPAPESPEAEPEPGVPEPPPGPEPEPVNLDEPFPLWLGVVGLFGFSVPEGLPRYGGAVELAIPTGRFYGAVRAGARVLPAQTARQVRLSMVELPITATGGLLFPMGERWVLLVAGRARLTPTLFEATVIPRGLLERLWDLQVDLGLAAGLRWRPSDAIAIQLEIGWQVAVHQVRIRRAGIDQPVYSGGHLPGVTTRTESYFNQGDSDAREEEDVMGGGAVCWRGPHLPEQQPAPGADIGSHRPGGRHPPER